MRLLIYIIVYPLLWILSILPMRILQVISTFFYFLVYYLIGYRKKVVLNNLQLVFPDKLPNERKIIAKKFYKHFCDMLVEMIKSISISEKEINKRFHFENPEIFKSYYENNRSVLLMCGHYASWEWTGHLKSKMNHKGYAVYKPIANPHLDKLVKKIRERFGATIISNKKVVKTMFSDVKNKINSVTLILSDQTPKKHAKMNLDTFMNIEVPVFTGAEELAKKLDFVCLYLKVKKTKRGFYTATFIPLTENPKEIENYGITRLFLNEIEKQIIEEPAYYLWTHKRWKHRIIAPNNKSPKL